MFRLVYMSTAVYLFSEKELEELLEKSIQNNSKLGITGLLATKGKTFLQCLEGDKEAVLELYSKIEKDERHFNVLTLIEEDIEKRLFPKWSMGYKNIENLLTIKSEKLKELTKNDLKDISEDEIYEIFEYLIN